MSADTHDQSPNSGRRAIEAEILQPDDTGHSGTSWNNAGYRREGNVYSYWSVAPVYGNGCLGGAITFGLFIVCLGQYGLLAAIGFMVFYAIGGVIGSVYAARRLMGGMPANPWVWRIGNWLISFTLTVWLAGGFSN